jgi:methyl-accepting chemotaxis protein
MAGLTRSLNTKLLLAVVALSVIPLIVVAVVSVNRARSALTYEAGTRMEIAAIETGDKVDRVLLERYRDAQAFAANPRAVESAAERAELLDFYMKKYGFYDLMMVVNLDGRVVGVNGVDGAGETVSSDVLLGADVSEQAWFQAVRSGDVPLGSTYYTDAQTSDLVNAVYGDDRLTLPFTAPIFDPSGQLVAVWHNEASFERIVSDIMVEVRDDLSYHGMTTVETQVLRADGLVLDGTPQSAGDVTTLSTNLAEQGLQAAEDLVAGDAYGFTTETAPTADVEQIIGFAASDGTTGFDGYGWGILVRGDSSEALSNASTLQTFMLIIGLLSIAAAAAAAYYLARWVSEPIAEVSARADQIAQGNLAVEPLSIERDDELGDLATSFNEMVATLSVAGAQADAIAGRHISNPVLDQQLPGDFGRAIHSMVTSIREVVHNLSDTSTKLAAGATELSAASLATASEVQRTTTTAENVSHAGDEVSSSVNTVAAAIEELNASIQEVSSSASNASNTATDAVAVAQSASERIGDLGRSSEEIGNVVQVISSIAEQTNLLALNATIEAARAGESGKGFAVVANEVKELANQTAVATEEISNRIHAIQSATAAAIEANDEIGTTITQISDISTSIAAAVEQQSSATFEIGRSMEDAATGADEIAQSINDVAGSAAGAQESTAQTQQAAEGVAEVAEQLDRLIAGYH